MIRLDGVVSLHAWLKPRRCRRNSDSSGHLNVECGVQNGKTQGARSSVCIPHSALRIPHSERSQSVTSSARRSAKAEVRGANPRESAILIYDFGFAIDEVVERPYAHVPRKS